MKMLNVTAKHFISSSNLELMSFWCFFSSLRSMTPESLTTPITEESLSTYMDMSPSQTSAAIMGDAPYLSMSPGQAKPVALTSVQHARSSSLPVTTQNSVGHESSNKPYLAMSPGQVTPETNESSSYMAMLPGQHSNSMTTLPSQQGHSHSIPYSPPSQRASRPETPPSQRTSRPGIALLHVYIIVHSVPKDIHNYLQINTYFNPIIMEG